MSDFVRRALLKRLNRENIISRLDRVENLTGPRPSARVESLGEIALEPGDAQKITAPQSSVFISNSQQTYLYTSDGGEQTVWSDILPSGSLTNTSGLIEIDIWGELFNNSGGSRQCTWKIYYGTSGTILIVANMTVNLTSWDFKFKCFLWAFASTWFHEAAYALGNRASGMTIDVMAGPAFNPTFSVANNMEQQLKMTWTTPVANANLTWATQLAKYQIHRTA